MSTPKYVYVGNINPAYSDVVSPLVPASTGAKLKSAFTMILVSLICGGIIYGIGYAAEQGWLKWTGIAIGGLLFLVGIFARGIYMKVVKCPYCGHELGKTMDDDVGKMDENQKVECLNCHEWLISHKGKVRAFRPEDMQIKSHKLYAPVYQGGVWQAECITCGGGITRTQDLKKTNVSGLMLLMGKISVASANVVNAPYCNEHFNEVSLAIKDDHPMLVFNDYEARRRYVQINKGKPVMKLKKKGVVR